MRADVSKGEAVDPNQTGIHGLIVSGKGAQGKDIRTGVLPARSAKDRRQKNGAAEAAPEESTLNESDFLHDLGKGFLGGHFRALCSASPKGCQSGLV